MPAPYPVSYSIQRPDRCSRWTVGFRFILGAPVFGILGLLGLVGDL